MSRSSELTEEEKKLANQWAQEQAKKKFDEMSQMREALLQKQLQTMQNNPAQAPAAIAGPNGYQGNLNYYGGGRIGPGGTQLSPGGGPVAGTRFGPGPQGAQDPRLRMPMNGRGFVNDPRNSNNRNLANSPLPFPGGMHNPANQKWWAEQNGLAAPSPTNPKRGKAVNKVKN